jgi:hypothetical protein
MSDQHVQWPALVGGSCPACSSTRYINVEFGEPAEVVKELSDMREIELLHDPATGQFSACMALELEAQWMER